MITDKKKRYFIAFGIALFAVSLTLLILVLMILRGPAISQ